MEWRYIETETTLKGKTKGHLSVMNSFDPVNNVILT